MIYACYNKTNKINICITYSGQTWGWARKFCKYWFYWFYWNSYSIYLDFFGTFWIFWCFSIVLLKSIDFACTVGSNQCILSKKCKLHRFQCCYHGFVSYLRCIRDFILRFYIYSNLGKYPPKTMRTTSLRNSSMSSHITSIRVLAQSDFVFKWCSLIGLRFQTFFFETTGKRFIAKNRAATWCLQQTHKKCRWFPLLSNIISQKKQNKPKK